MSPLLRTGAIGKDCSTGRYANLHQDGAPGKSGGPAPSLDVYESYAICTWLPLAKNVPAVVVQPTRTRRAPELT